MEENFWISYKEERLLNKKNYEQLQELSLSDMDIKKLAHLKNKKGEYLLETYDIGYLVANLGHESFQNLEKQFAEFEKKRQQMQNRLSKFSIDKVMSPKASTIQSGNGKQNFNFKDLELLQNKSKEPLNLKNDLQQSERMNKTNYQNDSSSQRQQDQITHKNELNVYEFIWAFMSVLEHDREEELFITNALIEFYEHIKEQIKDQPLKWESATNMLIELMHDQEFTGSAGGANSGGVGKLSVKAEKKIRHPRNNIQEKMIRKLGLELPDLFGEDENKLSFFVKSPNADKKTHKSGINQTHFFKPTNQIICLDFNSSTLYAYDAEIEGIQKLLVPQDHPNDPTILDFAVDNKTERIGACLRDYSLCFWETEDQYKFEKVIKTTMLQHLQVKIWSLESCSKWVTTDKTNALHIWDLEFEEPRTLERIHKMKIMDVIDVHRINGMLSSSLDKNIIVWDLKDFEMRFVIDLKNSFSVHTLKYSYQHDLLFTASYETQIKIWHFDSAIECTNVSTLTGHESMVTAIDLIQDTNYLVSSDDFGCIKCWNLKNQQCIQTFRFNFEILVSKLIGVTPESFISVSNRIYLFNLTQLDVENLAKTKATISTTQVVKKQKIGPKSQEALLQSIQENEILDIFYSSKNDQIICVTKHDVRIIDCLTGKQIRIMVNLTKKDEDITNFALDETEKKFLVSDHMGSIQMFGYNSGKLIKQLQHHKKEVSCMALDSKNNLLLTSGFDNVIMIQSTTKENPQVLRILRHPLGSEDILYCKASFYLNVIATANDKAVLIWNYENMRLMGVCYVEDIDIRQIYFLEPYPILIVIDFSGLTYFFHLNYSESLQYYRAVGRLQLDGTSDEYYFKDQPRCMTKSIYCSQLEEKGALTLENECILAFGTQNGYIFMFEFNDYFDKELKILPIKDKRNDVNANPMRNDEFDGRKYFPLEFKQIIETDIFKDIDPQKDIPLINSQEHIILRKKMHGKESINLIKILRIQENRCIITCSLDGFIKMSNLIKGDLICSLNICNPLPAKWNLHYTKNRKRFMKIKRAIQTLRVINNMFRNEPLYPNPDKDRAHDTSMFLTQAFDLDYLISKYGEQNHHKTMKQATKDYLKVLESEVSSKTTLRNLQYRQNRMKEEKKEQNLREELEVKKDKEKKAAIIKLQKKQNKQLDQRNSSQTLNADIDLSQNKSLEKKKTYFVNKTESRIKMMQKKSLKLDNEKVTTPDIFIMNTEQQQSDRIQELNDQEQIMRQKLRESEVMEFTHIHTFELAQALDEAETFAEKQRRGDQSSTLSQSSMAHRKGSVRIIPNLVQRKLGSTKSWIQHAEEKGNIAAGSISQKKAFKEILKSLHQQVNRTRVQASKLGSVKSLKQFDSINNSSSVFSPTRENNAASQFRTYQQNLQSPQNNDTQSNFEQSQTLQFSQSQSHMMTLPQINLRTRLSLADKIDIQVQKAFDKYDQEMNSRDQSPQQKDQKESQNVKQATKNQSNVSKFFQEKRNAQSQKELQSQQKSRIDQLSSKNELQQINSIIKDTIHSTFVKDNSAFGEVSDTLNLLSKNRSRGVGLLSPQNIQRQLDKDRLFISNKMKKALFDKGKKDLNRLGLGKMTYQHDGHSSAKLL